MGDTTDGVASIINPILNSLMLFNCDPTTNYVCKKTIGYIKSSDTASPSYYSISKTPSSNAIVTGVACDTGKIGTLSSDGKLCLYKDKTAITTTLAAPTSPDTGEYILIKPGGDVFTDYKDDNIIVKVTISSVIFNNLATGNKKKYIYICNIIVNIKEIIIN